MYTPITIDFFFYLDDPVVAQTDGNRALGDIDINTRPILRVVDDTRMQVHILYYGSFIYILICSVLGCYM